MIKKVFLVLALLMLGMSVNAAAPTLDIFIDHADTITVDSTFYEGRFERLYTAAYIMTDTAGIFAEFSGTVTLEPGQDLWLGYGTDSVAATGKNGVDSQKVASCPLWANYPWTMSFTYKGFVDSMLTQVDETDTVYVNGAIGGPRTAPVIIYNPTFKVSIVDMLYLNQ